MTKYINRLIESLSVSHSPFHVTKRVGELFIEAGFKNVSANNDSPFNVYESDEGIKYALFDRNNSSIALVKMPNDIDANKVRFNFMSAHTDSPTFKLKPNPLYKVNNLAMLNVEPYGGLIANTWFDKPLTFAGRVVYSDEDNSITSKLIYIDRNLLNIPNLAIHMNRDINSGHNYNFSKDTLPVLGFYNDDLSFKNILAYELNSKYDTNLSEKDILSFDLFLETREIPVKLGLNDEFLLSPKIDDLGCVYGCLDGFLDAKPSQNVINSVVFFDNEEVGSLTRQGADSTFFEDLLKYISSYYEISNVQLLDALSRSFMISADNAHATHPNFVEKADRTSLINLGEGIVVKTAASQTYTTDSYGSGVIKYICNNEGLKIQEFTNRSDMRGGSTLGNISNAHVSVPSVDIGLPQLAMHSSNEMCAIKDYLDLVKLSKAFFSSDISLKFNNY